MTWLPNRDPWTPASKSWLKFIKRLGLAHRFEDEHYDLMLEGADGWAFTAAMRFQDAAHELSKTEPEYYWSGYYLLAQVIDKARKDPDLLQTIEQLAVAKLYGIDGDQFPQLSPGDRQGTITNAVVQAMLKNLGVWP